MIIQHNMLEFLQFPFMQRALVGGLIAALLLGWVGVYATSRNMSFVGAGVAHASLAAIAFAILVGWAPVLTAVVFSVILGIVLYFLDTRTTVSRDTAIGILFSAGMALGVLFLQFHDGYVPELMSFLFGTILSITPEDVFVVALVGMSMMAPMYILRHELLFITIDPEGAYLSGMNKTAVELFLYILTSVAVVLSIKLVGIVLVSALLVLPSAIAKSWAQSFSSFIIYALCSSVLIVIVGLIISFYADWPSGAAIVLFGTTLFLISRLFKRT